MERFLPCSSHLRQQDFDTETSGTTATVALVPWKYVKMWGRKENVLMLLDGRKRGHLLYRKIWKNA